MKTYDKAPRLFLDSPLTENFIATLEEAQSHYLGNVLRLQDGNPVRVFNGRDGEWIGSFTRESKKKAALTLTDKLKNQKNTMECHLIFAPIKKTRMDFLVEKAVELGVTHLHPVLTQNTEVRKIKEDRIRAQIIEAAEQCERLDIPVVLPIIPLEKCLKEWNYSSHIAFAIERYETDKTIEHINARTVLVGPEGGFTSEETDKILSYETVVPTTLGERILRAETAALSALAQMNLCGKDVDTSYSTNEH